MASYGGTEMSGHKCVLIISALDYWSMGDGKGGPALHKTLTGYAERGWKVYFITGNHAQDTFDDLHENIHVIRFDAPWLKRVIQIKKIGFFAKILWWVYFQMTAFIKAQKLRSKNKIDVVYGYEICGVPVAKILSKLWGVPVVARFRGSIVRLVWMKRPFWKLRAWEYVLAYKISSASDLVIMTNDGSQGDQLLAQMGVRDEKVRFWINGLDTEPFQCLPVVEEARESLKISHRYVLLSVSRLMRLKRVDRSIHTLPDVIKEYPDTILVIVGDGPERERLEQLAVELGVREHVRFEGAVPHKEVPKYLAAADIFLSFYDWSNVGNPLLEAMTAGKCIVTLNNGDTGRFVQNGVNGVLLEYEDLPKLPEVIEELLADEERRERLGANARQFAEEHFWTWEERIDAEVQEVSALVERWRRP
jgi:glycosyltransferase involved in cell wall biosynthesis